MPPAGDHGEVPRVKSVAKAAAILLAIAAEPEGLRVKEISEIAGIGTQSTYQFLQTLRLTGFVVRRDRRYILGLAAAAIANGFSSQAVLPEHVTPLVRKLARESGETVYAAGWWQGEITVLATVRGKSAVSAAEVPIGLTGVGHARASGKFLLAHAAAETLEQYLASHPLRRRTEHTICKRGELFVEFELIKRQGYATDIEEFEKGLCCVAYPIGQLTNMVLALSAPTERFERNFDSYLSLLGNSFGRGEVEGV